MNNNNYTNKNLFHLLLLFVLGIILNTSCDPRKEFHDDLKDVKGEKTIYRLLRDSLDCNLFADMIDRVGYTRFLDVNNRGTVFAPTDSAVKEYLKSIGASYITIDNKTSFVGIDSLSIAGIVTYCILPDTYNSKVLLFSTFNSNTGTEKYDGIQINYLALRRYTLYRNQPYKYKPFYDTDSLLVYDSNNKYIPLFAKENIELQGGNVNDYKLITGRDINLSAFNVADAKVQKEHIAINGNVFTIDKVVKPLPNAWQQMRSDTSLSIFYYYIDKYFTKTFYNVSNYAVLEKALNKKLYQIQLYPISKNATTASSIFYMGNNFNFNNDEGIGLAGGTASWGRGIAGYAGSKVYYTYLIPNNNAFRDLYTEFYKSSIPSIYSLSDTLVFEFIKNSIMVTPLYPSTLTKFAISGAGAYPIDFATQVEKTQLCSNGILYVMNKMISNKVLASTLARFVIEPQKYKVMKAGIEVQIASSIYNQSFNYSVFLVPDVNYALIGYLPSFDNATGSPIVVKNNAVATEENYFARSYQLHIIKQRNLDLSGEGYLRTFSKEYVYYKNNTLKGGGNIDTLAKNPSVDPFLVGYTINKVEKRANGECYYNSTGMLLPSRQNIAQKISTNPNFAQFRKYFGGSGTAAANSLKVLDTTLNKENLIGFLGAEFTAFIPSNAAVLAAIASGKIIIPKASDNQTAKDSLNKKLKKLFQNHIIATTVFTLFPNQNSTYNTFTDKSVYGTGDIAKLLISITGGTMNISNNQGSANVILGTNSNIIAKDGAVHEIDNVLFY